MAMNAGSVSLDPDGLPTGSGLARELFDGWAPSIPFLDPDDFPVAQRPRIRAANVAGKQRLADQCDAFAAAVVSHIAANAEVTVTVGTGDAGLQRLPATLVENEPTKGPSGAKVLGTKGTVA